MQALKKRDSLKPQSSHSDEFSPEGLAMLQSAAINRAIPAGALLFSEGEAAGRLYLVKKGRIKLFKASSDGKQITFSVYGPGDLFGQWIPYAESKHTMNAEAAEDTELGVLTGEELERMLMQHPGLAMMMMKWLGLNNSRLESKLRDLMLFGKTGALCSVLIRLSNTYGVVYGTDICISHKVTYSELAEMIGSTREGVNRMLSDMKQEGLIAIWDGLLVLKDMEYLRRMCQCDKCPPGVCRL